ncbi:Sec-independent protein translocase subunit TatA/TatB [Deinococcus maricopensis]|uniref:Sec-independent protein translocase protein TatA n=1 Tax=Deinococcus maricopensis (strain DSM 21211 / LMG 22137 / NRRL B-23946 / LB-34) TaxID=709986 RepID=E8U7C2_DEIML|nr:twin-arginine translocase TatA/TatE family subunit [Deinococcus maricopensis]ADV66961.1 Sec-independent protein translocase protein tatA/E-like protein [Deinococcus maricopensis DSM 21211]
MPNLGFPEILLILVIALLVFGPKKLPELGKSLGQGIRSFREGTQGLKDELDASFKDAPPAKAATTQTVVTVKPEPVQVEPASTDDRRA